MSEIAASDDAPETPPKRLRRALLRALHAGLGLGGVALLIATFLPLLHPFWPLAAVAEHFALQVLIGAVLLGVLALLLRRWRWLGLVAGVAFIQIWTIHPYWPSFVPGAHAARAEAGGPNASEMKVISLNVHHSGRSFEEVRQYLRDSGADVIGLVEISRRWKTELAPLAAIYPFRIDCIDTDDLCEEMLLSKHPFQRQSAGRTDNDLPMLVWGEIALPGDGKPVTFAVSHVAWPFLIAEPPEELATNPYLRSLPNGLPRLVQSEQVVTLADTVNGLGNNLVLMGDFNAAPWSRIQQYLHQQSGVDDPGHLAPSWPAWGPTVIRLPIDHIMTRGTLRLVSFETGPDVGSDHLPVEAILALTAP